MTDPENMEITHRMNVELGTEAAQFQGKEYIKGIFVAVQTGKDAEKVLQVNLVFCATAVKPFTWQGGSHFFAL